MGSMAPPFDLADLPTGVAMPLSPLVARVLAPNPSPFTFTGTQTYVVGSSDVAVIDPGPPDEAHLPSLTAATARRPAVPDRRRVGLGNSLDLGGARRM